MIREAVAELAEGRDLSGENAAIAMAQIMDGDATDAQVGALVTALRMKGETPEEIAGMAQAMRERSLRVDFPGTLVDTCGTGGDGSGSFNVSTAAALVVAGAGGRVAKHGNRSVSSASGSADVLEALGAAIDLEPDAVATCIDRTGFGFMFAQRYHPSMRHAARPRREIGIRTVFNILGPLTNPAGVRRQVIGVADPEAAPKIARVLALLGAERALVVHGYGGADEIMLTGATLCLGAGRRTVSRIPGDRKGPGIARGLGGIDPGRSPCRQRADDQAGALRLGQPGPACGARERRRGALCSRHKRLPGRGGGQGHTIPGHRCSLKTDAGVRGPIAPPGRRVMPPAGDVPDILRRIVDDKAAELQQLKAQMPVERLKDLAAGRPIPLNLAGALTGPAIRLIAEVKRRSPTSGSIGPGVDAGKLAGEYADGGAAAISVLTNAQHFGGSIEDLSEVTAAVRPRGLPVMRKEFIFDPYQVYEARAHGADAVLLIVAMLNPAELLELRDLAQEMWMQVLVEVHDEAELGVAVDAGAEIIGINNRNLRTFETDLSTTERLAPMVPDGRIIVAESGIRSRKDIERVRAAGAHAALIGESLVASDDPAAMLRELQA